ncbi:MAG: AraC family transcriptional regulator [Christensenellales bacterium]
MQERIFPNVIDSFNGSENFFAHYGEYDEKALLYLYQFGTHITTESYSYGPAVRNHDLIHFVLQGSGDLTLTHRRYRVSRGELFYIPKGCVSFYEASDVEPWRYAWIGFGGTAAERALTTAGLSENAPVARFDDIEYIKSLFAHMRKAFLYAHNEYEIMADLYRMMGYISGLQAYAPRTDLPELNNASRSKLISRVLHRVDSEFFKSLSMTGLAKEFGVSRGYLSKEFKRFTGQTFSAYVTQLRMSRARTMMMNSDATVTSIAEQCGYGDPFYFSRVFKKVFGMPPSQMMRSKDE